LPSGTYGFYFAIDTNKNGILDFDQLYYDRVEVSISESSNNPVFEFLQGDANCGSQEGPQFAVINNDITFSGKIGASNPCFYLSAELNTEGNNLNIIITSIGEEVDMCVLCIGAVEYSGKISDLNSGTYEVSIESKSGIFSFETVETVSITD
jgi:hypothetical protein